MPIPPTPTREQQARDNSYLILGTLIRIIEGTAKGGKDHHIDVASRFHYTTEAAADPSVVWHTESRAMYERALPGEELDTFLRLFNESCERFRANTKGRLLSFESEADKKTVIEALAKLQQETRHQFHIPYPGMGHERTSSAGCCG